MSNTDILWADTIRLLTEAQKALTIAYAYLNQAETDSRETHTLLEGTRSTHLTHVRALLADRPGRRRPVQKMRRG